MALAPEWGEWGSGQGAAATTPPPLPPRPARDTETGPPTSPLWGRGSRPAPSAFMQRHLTPNADSAAATVCGGHTLRLPVLPRDA